LIAQHAKAANKGSRIFTFGVGDDLNARLLDRIAEEGQGTSDFVRDEKDFELKIGGFYDKVANPVLADVALDLGAFGAYDVYPRRLGDLFKGQQLVVMGRYRTPKESTVVLSGSVNGKKTVFEYRGEMVKEGKAFDFVPRLWAIRKVGYLLEEIRLHGEKAELKDEIVSLGKKYGIVTPYTSYLVVEDTPMPVARNQPPPLPVPRPWVGGPLESKPAASPAAAPPSEGDEGFGSAFARGGGGVETKSIEASGGREAIAASKAVQKMKHEEVAQKVNEPVRVASGRTFIYRSGGWIDSEALAGTAKQLEVKYLSDAYFALLKARPDLKAALALSDRLVIVVAKGKSIVIDPAGGETKADAVKSFLE
jgi:Ca-activated chloride channel family protein